MELLEAFYRRKLRKKQKKLELGRSDGALCRSPSETSVNKLATGLISKVLRFTHRGSEQTSRPHSWHSTKLGEGHPELDPGMMDSMSTSWHQSYPTSASTTDLSGGFDTSGGYLRKSPDQYSSRGSMESLDPTQSPHQHPTAQQQQHPLGPRSHSGSYSSCQQLSSARSSNSIDHLHSKRDSAYSSFSTSSSIPEYLASTPSFSPERSYSLETVPQRGGGSAEMLPTDMRYVRSIYDAQQGLSQEHELNSSSRGGARPGPGRDHQGSVGGVCFRGANGSGGGSNTAPASNRHSVGPIWGQVASRNSYESLKGAPAPPRRSDSYAAIRNHERPNSWSSLDHARSLRSLQKGSWHHSSGPVATAKGSHGVEGQLHTVMEKSPESSPTTKPRQGGGFSLPPSPTGPSSGAAATASTPSRPILPAGVYPVPQPEPQYAQTPSSGPGPGPSGVYVALTKESSRQQVVRNEAARDERMSATENGHQSFGSSPHSLSSYSGSTSSQLRPRVPEEDRQRDQPGVDSEPPGSSRVAQGQAAPPAAPAPAPAPTPHPSARLLGDPAAPQHPHWNHRDSDRDSEHPLTRLEIALAEVQRCAVPDGNGIHSPARCLSVLEKVSHFERRKDGGKPRSYSTSSYGKTSHLGVTDKGRSSPCGAEDLRNMLERSTKGIKAHRTMSYRGGSNEYMKHRTPADPVAALQRSRSTFQLDGSKEGDISRNLPLQHDEPVQDASANRSYRDSVKDAQPNVLRSTSFRRRDLSSSVSSLPSDFVSSGGPQPFPVPAKYNSLEKKGPKTKPKPQSVVIASPHTPKERHLVSPDSGGQSPPPLPSVPPVGPPHLTRICGRKRLTADQKKRSYSEPENMNEVGVSDPETSALFRRGGETSVADRRKMFELAAGRGGGALQGAVSRSDLRQARRDALVEYVERKRGVRREEGGRSRGARPCSAYFQPEQGYHTDTYSLSSTSSLLSLQDTGSDQSFPNLGSDLRSLQSNLFYPGRVTTPRPPAQPIPGSSSGSGYDPEAGAATHGRCADKDVNRSQERQTAEPQRRPGLTMKLNEALQRAGSVRRSGRSASAEDILEHLENRHSPQHVRSRSSPTAEKLDQSVIPDDVKIFGISFSESERCALAADRPADINSSEDFSSTQSSRFNEPEGSSQDISHTPVTRRERRRKVERLRAYSTSTLAASVGLPAAFSPAGNQQDEWKASERLDAIAFPEITQTGDGENRTSGGGAGGSDDGRARRRLSDGTAKDGRRGRTFSSESGEGRCAEDAVPVSPVTTAPPPHGETSGSSAYSAHPHLSSLRISESSLMGSFEQQPLQTPSGNLQEEFDEVFLHNPPPPPPPLTPPIQETYIMEDFPPPPPPPPTGTEADPQSFQSSNPEIINGSVPIGKSSVQSSLPAKPSSAASDVLVFQYQPLPKREKTPEERRVEALARQLASQHPSLAPLLDTCVSEYTMKLMEEIFSNSSLTEEAEAERRGSSLPDERIQADDQAQTLDGTKESDVDDGENDLNIRKVELCEALRSSVAALQREKEALCEEQKRHQALGAGIEALIQEQLKTNEKEKYSIFIGDLERIVNLLLSLCSRLSRVDKSLLSLERDESPTEDAAEERDSLHHKRSLLLRQTEDARELKENLDRRQRVVNAILSGYLTEAQLRDYRHFVSAKPSLLIRQRHLDDLIRQRGELLTRLTESLPTEPAEARCWSPSSAPRSAIPCAVQFARSTTVTSL